MFFLFFSTLEITFLLLYFTKTHSETALFFSKINGKTMQKNYCFTLILLSVQTNEEFVDKAWKQLNTDKKIEKKLYWWFCADLANNPIFWIISRISIILFPPSSLFAFPSLAVPLIVVAVNYRNSWGCQKNSRKYRLFFT